ncbi:MAG: trypsin-like peptidase domain-containing protein [archaeon]
MAIKRHHKWLIGSFTSIVIIYMITSAVLLNGIIIKQTINYNTLTNSLSELDANTQSKINELTENLLQIKKNLESSQEELTLLKANVGADFSGIVSEAVKSVVTIKTDVSQGTGFIINSEGYIVTNAHVLADKYGGLASGIKAITYQQQTLNAEFVGYDGELDIALLKISGIYTELKLEDSNNIQIGEKVIAIGNPLGLQFSVSEGIVSGIHREGISGLDAYIQTDAALNPGNSGGPLINKNGKAIGINNFKVSGGESLGFALESNYIKEAVNRISTQQINQTLII